MSDIVIPRIDWRTQFERLHKIPIKVRRQLKEGVLFEFPSQEEKDRVIEIGRAIRKAERNNR